MADTNETQGAAMGASAGAAAGAAADGMRDGMQRAQGAFSEQVVEPAKRAGEAMRAGGQKVAENTSQISVKMIDQAQSNTQEAFEAMRRAAQAKDLSEVMRIQGEYLREQSTRSMTQAREIGELIMQFGRDAVSGMRSGSGGQG